MLYFLILLGLALAQTTNSTNSTNSTGLANATVGFINSTTVNSTNTTGSKFNATLGTSNSSEAGSNSTSGEQGQSSSEQSSTEQTSTQSSTESGQGQQGQGTQTQTQTTTTTTQQGKGKGQQKGQGKGQQQQGQQQQGQQGKGRFMLCRTCGAACSTPQIRDGVCNMKLKCMARKAIPPNCGPQRIRPAPVPVMAGGQGQFVAGGPSQFSSGQGQFNSFNQGQNSLLSMSGQLAATSSCGLLNCPIIPTCSFPAVLQTPMISGCPGCPTCVIPGGCTADFQCSAGTYCVLGRCLTYAQEGDPCGTIFSSCQPPSVCTVMGTCYLPDCSCGFLPCPLDQQVTNEPDLSLVTGGCPPCPTCQS